MNLAPIVVIALALACTGCKTVIIRPSAAPTCVVPDQLKNACIPTAAIPSQVTYGDLPEVTLRARQDFLECRKSHGALLKSYEFCTNQLQLYNEKLRNFENDLKAKYQDAELREN